MLRQLNSSRFAVSRMNCGIPAVVGLLIFFLLSVRGATPQSEVREIPKSNRFSAEGLTAARRFWSFQPLSDAPLPHVKRADWTKTPLDFLILAKLEEKGLSPSAMADKRMLLRRASYDLTGLPPSPEEVEAFLQDHSPDAFAKVVDRLLASPRYGEQWGRHWLDVARYGDTRWVGAAEDRRFPFAYTYRDWVIGALNRDMPYDQFVTLQLAADQLPSTGDQSDLAALGFLTIGKWFTGNIHDVIDDQIDVVTRGLLGLSVQCARCHDHKFDPISTDDYYSLYGLFAASRMPFEGVGMLATLPEVGRRPIEAQQEKELAAARDELDAFLSNRQKEIRDQFSPANMIVDYMLAAQPLISKTDKDVREFSKTSRLDERVLMRWVRLLKRTVKEPQPIFGPWHAFAALSEAKFASKAADVANEQKAKKLNPLVAAILSPAPVSQFELAARYAELFLKFAVPKTAKDADEEAIRQILRGNDSPVQIPLGEMEQYFSRDEKDWISRTRRELLEKLARISPQADHYLSYHKEETAALDEVVVFMNERRAAIPTEIHTPEKIADYLLAAQEGLDAEELRIVSIANGKKLSERMLKRWITALKAGASHGDTFFAAWRSFAALPEKEFSDKAAEVCADLKSRPGNHFAVAAMGKPPASLHEVATRYAALILEFDKPDAQSDADGETIRRLSGGPQSLTHISREEVEDFLSRKETEELRNKENKLARLYVDHAGSVARAMTLREAPRDYHQNIFIRGNPNTPGDDSSGKFLAVLSGADREPFHRGAGRLELARAIVDQSKALTARVIVNRVWMHHFGAGLVGSPSDFGARGDAPTHPELLDLLARQFIADGWSLKKLHRWIMLSAVYQQSSDDNAAARQVDPDNRLLWRMNRHRLSFEETRDSLLAISGRLDETMGGRPEDLVKAGARRRTVYGVIDRISLPGFYRYFDFPSADCHVPERHETIIPQQALFMMNNSFVMDQAYALAHRANIESLTSPAERIEALYRVAYGRPPTAEELSLGLQFIESEPPNAQAGPSQPWRYGFGSFDEKAGRVADFTPMPFFGNGLWKGGPLEIDPVLDRCSLNSRGGNAGTNRGPAVIRRWIAPQDGKASIVGSLNVQANALAPSGEGVRARIISSRQGQLGVWIAIGTEEPTNFADVEVHRGETIDFVVEARGTEPNAGFSWAPILQMDNTGADSAKKPKLTWDASKDFADNAENRRQYRIWDRFAQILLESNEFLFLD
jgi:hypothetical protein